jgi:hypothetical protein
MPSEGVSALRVSLSLTPSLPLSLSPSLPINYNSCPFSLTPRLTQNRLLLHTHTAMLQNPEFLRMLRDPSSMQMLQQAFADQATMDEPIIPRDIFDIAIGCMNGEDEFWGLKTTTRQQRQQR